MALSDLTYLFYHEGLKHKGAIELTLLKETFYTCTCCIEYREPLNV